MDYSDESDLTDIEESEREEPLAGPSRLNLKPASSIVKAEPGKKKTNGARLKQAYLEPLAVESIYSQLKAGMIDLNPEYQRSVVWDDVKQGSLIDSLLHNYVVFPLVFAERQMDDGCTLKVCIDGKQRITSIQQFIDGKIPYRDSQTNHEMWFEKVPKGRKGGSLTEPQRQRFRQVMVSTTKYDDIDEHDEREVFQRVQNGVSLSSHERLRAYNGAYADLLRSTFEQTSHTVRQFFAFEKSKGKDFFMLGQVALTIHHHLSGSKKDYPKNEVSIARVETFLKKKEAPKDNLRLALEGYTDTLNCLIHDPQLNQAFFNMQPTLFVMSGFLIYLYRNTHSLAQLSNAVEQMKKAGRGVRSAPDGYRKVGDFVLKKVKTLKLLSDGKGDRPASTVKFNPSRTAQSTASALSSIERVTDSTPKPAQQPVSCAPDPAPKLKVNTTPKRKRGKGTAEDDEYNPESEDEAPMPKTRRKAVPLPAYKDEDSSDDEPIIKKSAPLKKLATPRPPISKITSTPGASASKAVTKVKRSPKAPINAKTSSPTVISSRVGKPSTKPAASLRTKNPTTAGATSDQSTLPKVEKSTTTKNATTSHMPTPPRSASTASATPVTSIVAPVPQRVSQLAGQSRPGTPILGRSRPPSTEVKAEPRQSPATSTTPSLPQSSSSASRPDRMAPLRVAKQFVAENQPPPQQLPTPNMSVQPVAATYPPTLDPRRRGSSNTILLHSPKDPEGEWQQDIDQIVLMSGLSPGASTTPSMQPSASAPPLAQHPAPRPPIQSSASAMDIVMADGTKDRNILDNAAAIGRLVPARPQKEPSFTHKSGHASNTPPVPQINTNINQHRGAVSAPAGRSAAQHTPLVASPSVVSPDLSFFQRSTRPPPKIPSAMSAGSSGTRSLTPRPSGSFGSESFDRRYQDREDSYSGRRGSDRDYRSDNHRRSRREAY